MSVGQSIAIRGSQLRPVSSYQLYLSMGKGSKARAFEQSLATDAFGRIEPTVVWPQCGLSSLHELRELTIAEAQKSHGGQTVTWELRDGRKSVAQGSLSVERASKEPVVFVSNKQGELRNAIEAGQDPLVLAGATRLLHEVRPRIYCEVAWNSADAVSAVANTTPRLRQSETVDYVAIAALKWPALRAAFKAFKDKATPERRADFAKFRTERGMLLSRFACFEALRHRFGTPWWEWPEEWRRPDEAACRRLREGPEADEIEFVEFVQWNADRQLGACKARADELGMKVGLYLDVAVGVQSNGFDAWNEQGAISRMLGVGAPPDPLAPAGQDWGLAGYNAIGLEQRWFEPFRQMLQASMRHAGAIRLDHVMGLKRLYLVPRGFGPRDGVYVPMPFEAMLALTALESDAHRCVVIGEDLGTVPEGFRDTTRDWGIWSYLVMMFERDGNGAFHGIDYYQPNALVTFNTHDLATYAGWRHFNDLKQKRALGFDPGESDDDRWHALTMLDQVLGQHGIHDNDFDAIAAFLARTKSRLMAVALEDLLELQEQPNIPGTIDQHPNWRRRMPLCIDEIASQVDVEGLKAATRERMRKKA